MNSRYFLLGYSCCRRLIAYSWAFSQLGISYFTSIYPFWLACEMYTVEQPCWLSSSCYFVGRLMLYKDCTKSSRLSRKFHECCCIITEGKTSRSSDICCSALHWTLQSQHWSIGVLEEGTMHSTGELSTHIMHAVLKLDSNSYLFPITHLHYCLSLHVFHINRPEKRSHSCFHSHQWKRQCSKNFKLFP